MDNKVHVVFPRLVSRGDRLLDLLFIAFWLMLPAYTANNCATLFGGGTPIDGGKLFPDGKRVLGDNKTYRGFILGTACGVAMGIIQAIAAPYILPYISGLLSADVVHTLPAAMVVAMPLGALTGDSVKSFFKRRLGLKEASMLPVADQLDFIIGALAFGFISSPSWFAGHFTLLILAIIILMTFPLQLFHNSVAVVLGKKKVLW
jgi:CDP-2,3-bis-(O-geranylgeranyl)-sn-glycerol synthase